MISWLAFFKKNSYQISTHYLGTVSHFVTGCVLARDHWAAMDGLTLTEKKRVFLAWSLLRIEPLQSSCFGRRSIFNANFEPVLFRQCDFNLLPKCCSILSLDEVQRILSAQIMDTGDGQVSAIEDLKRKNIRNEEIELSSEFIPGGLLLGWLSRRIERHFPREFASQSWPPGPGPCAWLWRHLSKWTLRDD